jgi:hypothetical protein
MRREIAVRHGRLLRVINLFGQIRTLELRNSARIVQTARFAFSPLTRSLTHVYGRIAQSRENLKLGSTPVRAAIAKSTYQPIRNEILECKVKDVRVLQSARSDY